MHEVMATFVGAWRSELSHSHMSRIERADQSPDDAALSRGIPALEKHAERWTKLCSGDESAELQP
jgi:hypothetical protein